MTNAHQPSDLPPMSKHHVLHIATIAADLPSHLFRPLLVLAVHADHRTGLSRPGQDAIENAWGIPYSSWHRQMQQLTERGLIRQVVKGNREASVSATYLLLYAPVLTGETSSSSLGETHPSPCRGGDATGEKGREDLPLNEVERRHWDAIADEVWARLEPVDARRLTEQAGRFDRMIRLQRTALRIAQRGGEFEVVEALTRRNKAGRPAYEGAQNVPAAMWSRIRDLADTYGIDMRDQSPVHEEHELDEPADGGTITLADDAPDLWNKINDLGGSA